MNSDTTTISLSFTFKNSNGLCRPKIQSEAFPQFGEIRTESILPRFLVNYSNTIQHNCSDIKSTVTCL